MNEAEIFCAGLSLGWFIGGWGVYALRHWIWKDGLD
jgi:hypothetical protein